MAGDELLPYGLTSLARCDHIRNRLFEAVRAVVVLEAGVRPAPCPHPWGAGEGLMG